MLWKKFYEKKQNQPTFNCSIFLQSVPAWLMKEYEIQFSTHLYLWGYWNAKRLRQNSGKNSIRKALSNVCIAIYDYYCESWTWVMGKPERKKVVEKWYDMGTGGVDSVPQSKTYRDIKLFVQKNRWRQLFIYVCYTKKFQMILKIFKI